MTRASLALSFGLLALTAARPALGDDGFDAFLAPPCIGVTRAVAGRAYCLHVPPAVDAGKPLPLVVLLHGYGASGQGQASYFGLDAQVAPRGFLLAKPRPSPRWWRSRARSTRRCATPRDRSVSRRCTARTTTWSTWRAAAA